MGRGNAVWLLAWFMVALGFVAGLCSMATAHEARLAAVRVLLQEESAQVSITIHRMPELDHLTTSQLDAGLALRIDGIPVKPVRWERVVDAENSTYLWRAQVKRGGTHATLANGLQLPAPIMGTSLNVVRLARVTHSQWFGPLSAAAEPSPGQTIPREVTSGTPSPTEPVAGVWGFIALGLRHILGGWDHLLFLASLLVWGGGWRRLLCVTTAFTLAHSLTLALAALNLVAFPSRWVEVGIAVSIVVSAVSGLARARPGMQESNGSPPAHSGPKNERDIRIPMAFGFGLLHGFGFAGALTELGLERATLLPSLVGFNLGVEMGQALVGGAALALLWALGRGFPRAARALPHCVGLVVVMAGSYWVVERLVSL